MQQRASRRLGEYLVERKVLARDVLEEMLEREAQEGTPLSRLLIAEKLVAEKDLVAGVAHQLGIRFVDLSATPIHPEVERMVPAEVAREHLAVAVALEGTELLVAMANPSDRSVVDAVAAASGWDVVPAIAERRELARVVAAIYGPGGPAPAGAGAEIEVSLAGEAARPTTSHSALEEGSREDLHVNELLERVIDLGGSDLHLTNGVYPSVRVHGDLKHLTEFPVMNGSELRRMLYAILTQKQREKFEEELELDTSHSIPGKGRFRVNIFLQRDSIGSVMRVIPFEIVPLDRLGLPPIVATLADLPRGLVLVTGPTGSGKSTTLASLIDIINTNHAHHIMTVEDPIEFLHQHKRCVVNQREVGEDTHSFAQALKHVLRQDPDVILVGEMRDLETISTAITAAETGHLVFATLHTQDAPQTVDRIIDVFPAHQQQQIRVQLASSLQAVVTQQLVPTKNGKGRTIAVEVMVATPAVKNLIREGKTHQIPSSMQAGGKYGMQTMDMSLAHLVKTGQIDMEMAIERCANVEDLKRLIGSA